MYIDYHEIVVLLSQWFFPGFFVEADSEGFQGSIWDIAFIFNIKTLIFLFNKSILLSLNVCKIAGWVANSVDPDQTPRSAASVLGSTLFV